MAQVSAQDVVGDVERDTRDTSASAPPPNSHPTVGLAGGTAQALAPASQIRTNVVESGEASVALFTTASEAAEIGEGASDMTAHVEPSTVDEIGATVLACQCAKLRTYSFLRSRKGQINRLLEVMTSAAKVHDTSRRGAPPPEPLSRKDLEEHDDHEPRDLYDGMCAHAARNANVAQAAARHP